MENKIDYYKSYRCPCGKKINNIKLPYPTNEANYKCECGSEWLFKTASIQRLKSTFETWPKQVYEGVKKDVLLNKRLFSEVIKDELKRLEDEYSFKFAYKSYDKKDKKTYLSKSLFEFDVHLSCCELSFHFGDKLDRLNIKIYSSADNTDYDILGDLKIFETHIKYYMEKGELSKDYKLDNFRTYEIEEIVSIENWI